MSLVLENKKKGLYPLIMSFFCKWVSFFKKSILDSYMKLGNAKGFANLIVIFFSLVTYVTTDAAASITWLTPRSWEGDTPLLSL